MTSGLNTEKIQINALDYKLLPHPPKSNFDRRLLHEQKNWFLLLPLLMPGNSCATFKTSVSPPMDGNNFASLISILTTLTSVEVTASCATDLTATTSTYPIHCLIRQVPSQF